MINKKRSYAQYHLELGQSDFFLRSCSVCGMMYAPGDESDEKLHGDFHKKYFEGIRFKGWRAERVVSMSSGDNCRILLVFDGDSQSHKRKVKEVLTIVEKELGFSDETTCPTLQFGGGFNFKRDVIRSDSKNRAAVDERETGAVLCEEESVPALCGFRGIWVVPSQRRKRIAFRLLDAARQTFLPDTILEHSQCAFSPPTSSSHLEEH